MKYVSIVVASILFIVLSVVGYRLISSQLKSLDTREEKIAQIELSELKKTGTKLKFTIKGPVVADENYREIVFEVGQGSRSVKVLKGYGLSLEKEMQLANNYSAYEAFAGALYSLGYINERSSVKNKTYQGECANGKVYYAEFVDAKNKTVKSLWRDSCSVKTGTMSATPQSVLELFKKQFPDYKTFSSDISID